MRKPPTILRGQFRRGKQRHARFAQGMTVGVFLDARGGWCVGDHQIRSMGHQIRQELAKFVFLADQASRPIQFQSRLEELGGQRFRDGVRDAHDQSGRMPVCLAFDRVHELLTGRKDVFGVFEHQLSHLRQCEPSPCSDEQLLAQGIFQLTDLSADRGLSQAEFFARFRHGAVLGDGPEIQEMMIVQPIHAALFGKSEALLYIEITDISNPLYLFLKKKGRLLVLAPSAECIREEHPS
ncbi:hypothetical protein COMA2_30215 [Candidatus Nitrospira nitrificans]|uniref:Uncharacterized protein n=1 Tax=Candidatus Nitrospira nitrificans TaxID=1742973 RepID=A0A0S4LK99_9BACT|nr:hypothetical protein COMA2_30215 [Candidatus Nitrospira nitrificans]